MMESDDDRLEYLKVMGEPVVVDGDEIYGIFEQEYLLEGDGPGVGSAQPQMTCRSIDVDDLQDGVLVVRDGHEYVVRGPLEPDGTGMTTVMLRDYG